MDYVKFGNTGMDVSRICLGAMGFGDPNSASNGVGAVVTVLELVNVKHIASAHGGEVSVWSRPGQGSTFTLRLPVQPAAGDPADREEVAR